MLTKKEAAEHGIRIHTLGEGITVLAGGWHNGEVALLVQPVEHNLKIGMKMQPNGSQVAENSTFLVIKNEKGLAVLESVVKKLRKLLKKPYVGTFNVLITEVEDGAWKLQTELAENTEPSPTATPPMEAPRG